MRSGIKNKKITYAYILILISFFLLSYGLFLNFQDSKLISNVSSDDIEETESVSITTSDGSIITSNDSNSNNIETKYDESSENYRINDIDLENDELRKEIQKKYGITIKYGKETEGYTVAGINTFSIDDSNIVKQQLVQLNNTLKLYPVGLFQEISDGGIPLTIILINSYSQDSITGITESSYTSATISIAAIYPFMESFFHESYHYIERYLLKNGANYNYWDSLNPDGFQYGTIYNNYSYSNTFMENAPFVNNYAQTADAEDRASTFEYMMANSKASCLNNGNIVWKKASYISRTMDIVLNTVSPDVIEYWERFL